MKPNFALDLSHDGIRLLHRGKDGWHMVGNVDVNDADLVEKLGFLHKTAAALESGGVTTKLVIPNSQILYTTIDAPGPSEAKRHKQIRAALNGTTPYDIDDLAFDWCEADGKVRVAAIARETLAEAEAFALDHNFNPLSFVAIPDAGKFEGEPFFGMAGAAEALLEGAETVERDSTAIQIIGIAEAPKQDKKPSKFSKAASKKEDKPAQVDKVDQDAGALNAEPPKPKPAKTKPAKKAKPSPAPKSKKPPVKIAPPKVKARKKAAKPKEPVSVIAGFVASFGDADEPDTDTPKSKSKSEAKPAAPDPNFTSSRNRKSAPPANKTVNKTQDAVEQGEARMVILSDGATPDATKLAKTLPTVPPVEAEPKVPEAPFAADAKTPLEPVAQKPADLKSKLAKIHPIISPLRLFPKPPTDEEQAMTVFGARKKLNHPLAQRYVLLGLVMGFALFALIVATILWSTLFRGGNTPTDSVVATISDSLVADIPAPVDPVTTALTPDNPSTDTVGDALALLTEPTIISTALPEADSPNIVVQEPEITAALEPLDEPIPELGPEFEPEPEPETPEPMTLEMAQTAYLETGIWQLAPTEPPLPQADEIDTLYIASIDAMIVFQDPVVLPPIPASNSGSTFNGLSSPTPHGTKFVLDEHGLVIPSADGTLTPDGVVVFAGPPPTKPRERGNRVPQVIVVSSQRLHNFRPGQRPADLLQRAEAAQLGGMTRAELAKLRPKPRPIADKAAAEADTTPTSLAVVLSKIPPKRPQNFAKLVERARQITAQEKASAPTAAPTPNDRIIRPSAPTGASVARMATVKNAINLRRVNLIGIYGSPSTRRALVRLPNGRYVQVKVGQRVNGGKVATISESELRYVKGGRTIVLKMPKT